MKRVILMLAAALLMMTTAAMADTITGTANFHGTLTLNAPYASATGVSTWSGVTVTNGTDLTGSSGTLAVGTAATISQPWTFNSGPVAPFWTAGAFTFNLTSSTGGLSNGILGASGTGFLSDDGGLTFTSGTWQFSTQNSTTGTFSFSASSIATPEPASLALLGSGLFGLGGLFRRKIRR
jgi:hypothetical protein